MKARLWDIERAKGLAIFLVVAGHLVARPPYPQNYDWYLLLDGMIYRFHMPFFMFLSGWIMKYSFPAINSPAAYWNYIRRKSLRLLPAFFGFAVLIGLGKTAVIHFLHVDNPPGHFGSALLTVLIRPADSYAASLWYIYVLFLYYLCVPPLLAAVRRVEWLLLIGLGVHFIPLPNYFAADRFAEYLMFFAAGMAAADRMAAYYHWVDRHRVIWITLFSASFLLPLTGLDDRAIKTIIGLLSIPALHGIMRLRRSDAPDILTFLGKYSFSIYLMNTIAIGVVKGVILKFTTWDGSNFFWVAPVLLVSGIFLPVAADITTHRFLERLPFGAKPRALRHADDHSVSEAPAKIK